jgi:hypothetical protein
VLIHGVALEVAGERRPLSVVPRVALEDPSRWCRASRSKSPASGDPSRWVLSVVPRLALEVAGERRPLSERSQRLHGFEQRRRKASPQLAHLDVATAVDDVTGQRVHVAARGQPNARLVLERRHARGKARHHDDDGAVAAGERKDRRVVIE